MDVRMQVVLKWILEKYDMRAWIGLMWLRIGTMAGCYEQGNKLSEP
jgi:hypothetical protein